MSGMYRVRSYDTLEGIAQRLLGDPGRWAELVALNDLRAPFISDLPRDHLGPPLAQGYLTSPFTPAAVTVDLPLLAPTLARQHGQLYLETRNVDTGLPVAETLTLARDGVTVETVTRLTVVTTPESSYPAGALWILADVPTNVSSRVAHTGDLLRLPADADTRGAVALGPNDLYADRLGRDIRLSEQVPQLGWDSSTHDVALVVGVANLTQALRLRLHTTPGEDAHHPAYGNPLLRFVGQRASALFPTLAEGQLRLSLSQDPRIERVEAVTTRVAGDRVDVDLTLRVRGVDDLVRVESLGLPNTP